MTYAEDKGKYQRCGPEAEGVAIACGFENRAVDSGKSASKRVLHVAAEGQLFDQGNDQKTKSPKDAVTQCCGGAQQYAVVPPPAY